jgi:hypothetical protein
MQFVCGLAAAAVEFFHTKLFVWQERAAKFHLPLCILWGNKKLWFCTKNMQIWIATLVSWSVSHVLVIRHYQCFP